MKWKYSKVFVLILMFEDYCMLKVNLYLKFMCLIFVGGKKRKNLINLL